MTLILSLNTGSSSLKISVFEKVGTARLVELRATAAFSNLSAPPSLFSFSSDVHSVTKIPLDSVVDHKSALVYFLTHVREHTQLNPEDIAYICHRVVHGGNHVKPAIVDSAELDRIQALSELAPLHNAASLSVIRTVNEVVPTAKSVAYFDSSFHTTIPRHIAAYPIDHTIALNNGLHKYGFHGLSYAFILGAASEFLSVQPIDLNLIVLHLGSGSSACAIRAGQSLDTTMELTPLSGLPGATRSGSVDPALLFHYHAVANATEQEREEETSKMAIAHKQGVNIGVTEAELILNKHSGWKAMTGTTDFGLITRRAFSAEDDKTVSQEDRENALLAFNLIVDRILNVIGAYHVKLSSPLLHSSAQTRRGVDALVFAGGIGEACLPLRSMIGRAVSDSFGYAPLDEDKNSSVQTCNDTVVEISQQGSWKTRVLVVRTDEQLEMAKECALEASFW